MSIESSLALAAICFIAMATPGPGILALIGRAMLRGLRGSAGFMLGMVAGDLVFLGLVIGGLAVIAGSFETTFLVVRYVAAGYLVYMGIKAWTSPPAMPAAAAGPVKSGLSGFFSGLLLTLSNPKVIVFYIGVLPGFIDLNELSPFDAMLAVVIVLGVLASVLVFYAAGAARARALLRDERARKLLNRGSGSLMIGVGVSIAAR